MGKSKKSKTSAVEAPISPVIMKQNKKVKKNKNLETAAKMVESEEIVQTKKSKKSAAKFNKSEEVQTEKNKKSTSAKAEETTPKKSKKKTNKKSIALEAAKEEETADKKSNKRKATSDANTKKSKRSNVENTIHVQLNHYTTEKSICEAFTKFGSVTSVRMPRKRGYCFVQFDSEECVKKAIAGKEDMKVDNQMVDVAVCQEKTKRIVNMIDDIFVAKISRDTTKQDIEEYFAKFGAVKKVSLPSSRNKDDNHKGFAFITFEDKSGVDATLAQSEHKIKSNTVVVNPPLGQTGASKKTNKKTKKETNKQAKKESEKEQEGIEGEEDDNEDSSEAEEDQE